jgi:uncharacterized protein
MSSGHSPRFERLDPANYRRVPWKNGGGVSVDIAGAYHRGAGANEWSEVLWRLARTRIDKPGPFSHLSGYDRILSVIKGRGLVLKPAEAPAIDAREPFRPVRFPGEWRIVSELEAGSVGVLNLITDRLDVTGDVDFLAKGMERKLGADINILYAPTGAALSIDDEKLVLAPDEAIRLQRRAVLRANSGMIASVSISLIRGR